MKKKKKVNSQSHWEIINLSVGKWRFQSFGKLESEIVRESMK
jgi:hypothetical protein